MGVETFDTEGKRDVNDETDKIIQAAMEEERREKRKKALEYQQQGGVGKAALLTDSDDEDNDDTLRGRRRKAARVEDDSDDSEGEEGRPRLDEETTHEQDTGTQIQEGLVAIAQKKRAAQRRGNGSNVEDTGLVGNIEQAEEQYDANQMRKEDMEKEHGIELEAFNLVEERKRGYFDKDGNYMEEEEEKEDDEEADAWLDAEEEKQVVDEATRRRIEERMMEQQDEPTKMTAIDIARVQYKVAKILRPEETVASALKRLGGGPRRGHGRKAVTTMDDENRALFDSLTECATILMDAGEIDVYSKDKRYFQSAASVYIDVDEPGGIITQSNAAYADADEDMFADNSEEEDKEDDKTQLESSAKFIEWPVKELKRFCSEHGKSCDGITEKSDLVALAVEISEEINAQKGRDPPAGYVYDPTSGYYYSWESKLYFDPASAGYFNPISREWYTWNGTTWIPWKH
ncbi:hypothetical protein PSENEW3n2_00001978 [Picochlorum sp. SENEW3]|nr:hypothetical protein PSENEW3n2_00001978 [Picochlorum sp. SENEW3]WPT14748.1 hypothetical protein PSENEW3_00001978 [Picochlorum sp. SENEW3]